MRKYRKRMCYICGKLGTSRSVKPTNWLEPTAPWAHPACWREHLESQKEQARKRQRQAHLAIRNFWLDDYKPEGESDDHKPEGESEVPGSGAYNVKYGFDR